VPTKLIYFLTKEGAEEAQQQQAQTQLNSMVSTDAGVQSVHLDVRIYMSNS